jgi:hypothetical protein
MLVMTVYSNTMGMSRGIEDATTRSLIFDYKSSEYHNLFWLHKLDFSDVSRKSLHKSTYLALLDPTF